MEEIEMELEENEPEAATENKDMVGCARTMKLISVLISHCP